MKQKKLIVADRLVHRSVRVGFVPNSEQTWSLQVSYTWTCCLPANDSGLSGRTSSVSSRVLVGFGICESSPNFAKISLILLKSAGFCWIWPDLEEIKPNVKEIRPNIDEILSDLDRLDITRLANHSNRWRTTTFGVEIGQVDWKSVFHAQTRQPTCRSQVLGAETRRQPSPASGQTILKPDQPGWAIWSVSGSG